MKRIKFLFLSLLIGALAVSCEKGLDPIEEVDPGTDQFAPTVEITYPVEGKLVRLQQEVGTIVFKFIATDDFELKSVKIELDGAEIGNLTSFKDYRRADVEYKYTSLLDGDHVFTVTVKDMQDKSATQTVNFRKITADVYEPLEGEVLYFGFEGAFLDLITGNEPTVVGSPTTVEGKLGEAYAGAADSYLEYPTAGLLGQEFSVAFWYKLNPDPVRGGMISISRGDQGSENRKWGFRMFRENDGTNMKFGVNFGIGTDEVWMNPFMNITPSEDWIHFAVTISATAATIYVNGEVILENPELAGAIDWTECSSMTIASGMPNFTYWDHFSDLSLYDEMHFFNKAISADVVQSLFAAGK